MFMVHGENTTVILYQVNCRGERPFAPTLTVRVMVAFRDYHWLTHENQAFKADYKNLTNGGVCLQPYEKQSSMFLFHNAQTMDKASFWYKNMEYPKEIERGLESHEDHFSPFAMHFDLNKGMDCYVVATTKEYDKLDVFELLNKESDRRKGIHSNDKLFGMVHPHPNLPPSRGKEFSGHMLVQACSLNQNVFGSIYKIEPAKGWEGVGGGGDKLLQLCESLLSVSDSFIVKRESDKRV